MTATVDGTVRRYRVAISDKRTFYAKHVAYANIMSTRPQTMYSLADSPIDLAAWMIDHGDGTGQPGGHFGAWEQPAVFSAELRAAFRTLRSR